MNFAGINGERRESILRILQGSSMTAQWVADVIYAATPDLLPQHGRVETIQKVLRAMERRGEVKRVRAGHKDIWSTS
jgi:hypothetical protein